MKEQAPLPPLPDVLYYPHFSINSLVAGDGWGRGNKMGDGKGRRMLKEDAWEKKGQGPGELSQPGGRHLVSGSTSRIVVIFLQHLPGVFCP